MSSVVPEGWSVKTFGDLTTSIKSGLSRRLSLQDIGIPVINSGNLTSRGLDTRELKYWYLDDPQGANTSNYVLINGDILLNFINSISQIGKSCIFRSFGRPCIYTTNIFRVRVGEKSHSEFVHHLMTDDIFQEEIGLITKPAVNQASFTKDELSNIRVSIPPLPEQKKISSILTSVDEVIENTQKQIDKLQDLKKATMNELLTKGIGHTEFKDSELGRIPKSWEVKKLKDIGECIRGLTYSPDDIAETGLLVLRSSNIQHGRIYLGDNVFVNLDVTTKFRTQVGDLLICVRNGSRRLLGKSVIIPEGLPPSTHGAFMTVFRTPLNKFVQFLLQSEWFFTQVSRDIGATINSINNSNLLEYLFVFPSHHEQTQIASQLKSIESLIVGKSNKLSQTQSLKKSLMQDLLTGKVRVTVN